MGKHRPSSKSAPTAADLIAQYTRPPAEPPVEPLPAPPAPEAPTEIFPPLQEPPTVELAAVGHPPARVRWAAVAAVASIAATGFLAGDDLVAVDTGEQPAARVTTVLPGAEPPTAEQVAVTLAALSEHRATQAAAEESAQAVQAAADQTELDRRAKEEADRAAEAEAARATQEAARQAAEAQAAQEDSQAAQDVTDTVAGPSSSAPAGDGVNAIVPGARITSGFGSRWGVLHAGVDLAAPLGSPIYSPFNGTVLLAGPASGFGNWVVIQLASGDVLVFGHMKTMFVSAGDHVTAGDRIALVGNEGQSTGPHCHVELHLGGLAGTKVDPSDLLGF